MIGAIAALLIAAAPGDTPAIKLWHSYLGREREGLTQALEVFKSTNPGFAVEASFVPFSALVDKLTAAIPRGHGPDVFIFAHDRLGGWAEGGLVEPIELWVDEPLLDRQVTPCVFALAYGDSLYGLPLAHKALALYLRTDRVKTPPETFDALLEIAKRETRPKEGRYGFIYPNADFFFHTPLAMSLGARLYDPRDPKRPIVTGSGFAASLALAHRLFEVEKILPDDPTPAVESAMFSDGRSPMVVSGPWLRSEIDKGVPYTVAPIPAFPGGKPASGFSTCEAAFMSGKSAKKKEAMQLIRFLSDDLRSAEARMIAGGQTVTLVEAWEKVLPKLPPEERAIFAAFRTAFERSEPTPVDPSMNAVWTPMNAALYKAIHKGTPPDEALVEAQARVLKALEPAK